MYIVLKTAFCSSLTPEQNEKFHVNDLPLGMYIQSPGYRVAYVHGALAIYGCLFKSMISGLTDENPEPTPGSWQSKNNKKLNYSS